MGNTGSPIQVYCSIIYKKNNINSAWKKELSDTSLKCLFWQIYAKINKLRSLKLFWQGIEEA